MSRHLVRLRPEHWPAVHAPPRQTLREQGQAGPAPALFALANASYWLCFERQPFCGWLLRCRWSLPSLSAYGVERRAELACSEYPLPLPPPPIRRYHPRHRGGCHSRSWRLPSCEWRRSFSAAVFLVVHRSGQSREHLYHSLEPCSTVKGAKCGCGLQHRGQEQDLHAATRTHTSPVWRCMAQ